MTARQPKWLLLEVVLAIHDVLIAEHGGSPGLRDRGLLESAIEAPKNLLAYGSTDIHTLAARYTVGISRNHPFVDGNKRAAFTCAAVFLLRNGWSLTATQLEVVETMVALADRSLDEKGLVAWLRKHTTTTRSASNRARRSARSKLGARGRKKRGGRPGK